MGASPDGKGNVGMGSTSGEKFANGTDLNMDIDEDDDVFDELVSVQELGEEFLRNFCRKAAVSFFNQYGLVSHQINSYNDFIKYGLQNTFDSFGEFVIHSGYDPSKKGEGDWRHARVKFGKVTVERPTFWAVTGGNELNMLPRHARLQNMTYSSRMKVTVELQVYTAKSVKSDKFKTGREEIVEEEIVHQDNREIIIGRIPVMIKSELCWMNEVEKSDCDFDHGGYFLIKGAEKGWTVAYRSEVKRNRLIIRLVENSKVEYIKGGEKILTVFFLSIEIPVWILFFSLGVRSDKEVVSLIDYGSSDSSISNILFASIRDADWKCRNFREESAALNHLDRLRKETRFPPEESVEECLGKYLFPSLKGFKQKARFLGYMVKSLLQAFTGHRKCDNRDDFRNKRLELAGELLEREMKVHIAHARRRMAKTLQRDLYADRTVRPIEHYLDASIVTNGLSRAFSTGAWSHPYKKMERISGVVANLGRANPLQTMVDLRKTRQQVQYTGKVGDARYPHPSHWGKVCFLSTPDGENCGLVKNLATTALVSTNIVKSVVESIVDTLFDSGMEKVVNDTSSSLDGKDKVFLNGEWVGVCEDSLFFAAELRRKRRRKELPYQVEIKRDEHKGEVRIFTDAGRILRPLLVVENLFKLKAFKGKENYAFQPLLDKGIVELIGAEEEEDCRTAWGIRYLLTEVEGKQPVKYTHCELDMSFLLGLSCGIIPFANHDHARRVLYQAQKHSQQAIGFSTTNPNIRVDTLSHQMYYPQRPLFHTMTADCLGKSGFPLGQNRLEPKPELYNGQNAIVAVNVHLGYNQEDSLVMNRASIERGMFRTEHVRSYKAEVDNKEIQEKRRKAEDIVNFGKTESKIGRVDSLDDDGFPYIGASLQSGDIVIGRFAESGADHGVKLKHTERGMVQKVVLSSNDDGKNFAVVSLRQVRSPCLGDKFSSMHGQKGVLGFLESHENFPFTTQGIVPDIVINPHAFPSRQTPGQLLEAALGKGIACGGSKKHATPFSTLSIDAITEQLHRLFDMFLKLDSLFVVIIYLSCPFRCLIPLLVFLIVTVITMMATLSNISHRAGFSRWGNERVYNGRTGEMVRSLIFMGPTFYQRLVHMAEDKVKFRNTGPVHPLTRQPVADRKRYGGIKFGEMERDCLIAHGASANLHERLFTLSDCSQMHVCQNCKNAANVIERTVAAGRKIRGPYCRVCQSGDEIVKVSVPYGAKLLCQELFSMGISLKFETQLC
ncbi:hypothetical protein Godav_016904 [Gossypium davidsonii]|uniref:DNA-directed RNA polymerase subunit beta n=2 Tax=Gossypium TaxID=3633 RepID=A0A7J8QSW6_GOSDV|nr:hypothetical protein [Gossypium davidsonii]MBA0639118.1 hypothetical protein [Gossypium klotzschianum]